MLESEWDVIGSPQGMNGPGMNGMMGNMNGGRWVQTPLGPMMVRRSLFSMHRQRTAKNCERNRFGRGMIRIAENGVKFTEHSERVLGISLHVRFES